MRAHCTLKQVNQIQDPRIAAKENFIAVEHIIFRVYRKGKNKSLPTCLQSSTFGFWSADKFGMIQEVGIFQTTTRLALFELEE